MLSVVLLAAWPSLAGPRPPDPPVAQEPPRTLRVGTKEAAPFSFRGEDGWRGLSIELWRAIAAERGWDFELQEVSLEELIDGLEQGRLDASVAALTVTAEREARIDFTHPFHPSGLGIATPVSDGGWTRLFRRVLSRHFVQAVGTLMALVFLAGTVLWLLERRRNPEHFGGPARRGLSSGFWWSAVTMTTVGYGDKAPATLPGRLFAVAWMFASVITISGLTAAIASALTVSRLGASISGPQDLPGLGPIATVEGSTSEGYLRSARLPHAAYPTASEALAALARGEHRALVYDAPILRYLVSRDHADELTVLPATFERQDYAIGLPDGSALREPINRSLLEEVGSAHWNDLLFEYLGPVD